MFKTYPKFPKHNTTEYVVQPMDKFWKFKVAALSFSTRNEAREFKRALKNSKAQVNSQILKREVIEGHLIEEEIH